ncbi:hypothetical protein GCM10009853_070900 [Glycomyces scopariae]
MSNTPQQPADGWQSPQQPPVYRPNEQPPEEPPPWSPESQRMSGMSQQQPGPVEADGTVKYVGGPGQQSPPPYGPPPGVPISPFDQPAQPMHSPQHTPPPMPHQMPAADPFGGGGGMPVSGMPVSGMPPVSSIPASGMPVSSPAGYGQQPPYGQPPFGGGQFSPQGGQLVPVSGGGAQPWGAPDTIKRKKKGKGPMWLLLVGVVVIAAALGVGGFILFNPDGEPGGDETGTISQDPTGDASAEAPSGPPTLVNEASGLNIVVPEGSTEATSPPPVFTDATGSVLGADGPTMYIGTLDNAAIGVAEEVGIETLGANLEALAATWAGGAAEAPVGSLYRVDAREAYFSTFTVAGNTVMTGVVQNGDTYVGFVGTATAEQVQALQAARDSISFGA